ncbi:MAG: Metalloprotease TldD [Phycisphaerae bacterium]|nr:Metalloprotease TldD [Phycisphaerae bacterium]
MRAVRQGAAFADARCTVGQGTALTVQDGRAENLSSHSYHGVGVRVLVDGAWGVSSCDALTESAMERARISALAAARAAAGARRDAASVGQMSPLVDCRQPQVRLAFDAWPLTRKIARLLELERAGAAAAGGHGLNSVLTYSEGTRHQQLANSAGTRIGQCLPHCRVAYTITAAVDDVRQQATEFKAHLGGLELLTELEPEPFSVRAASNVLRQCRARPAPSGVMPILFHPSITGLLAHEALGHNAEADTYWAGQSILQDKLGQPIAASGVTIVDDATVPGAYGSFAYDDEGVPAARNVIVRDGVFVGLLHNLETAARYGVAPNGCGRVEDHSCQPLARMSNTFIAPDPAGPTVERMIRSIDRGLYLAEGHEGYVLPERGLFVCRADSARLIRDGQLGDWLRDVSVSGLVLDALTRIEQVGSDFEMTMPGVCGKLGQGVPTDCGGPHVVVSEMVVGGID